MCTYTNILWVMHMHANIENEQEGDRQPLLRAELKLAKFLHSAANYVALWFLVNRIHIIYNCFSLLKPIYLTQKKLPSLLNSRSYCQHKGGLSLSYWPLLIAGLGILQTHIFDSMIFIKLTKRNLITKHLFTLTLELNKQLCLFSFYSNSAKIFPFFSCVLQHFTSRNLALLSN